MNSEKVLSIFKEITRIPRESGHEEPMTAFLQRFAGERHLGITKHPELFDRLIEWEKEDNIFHRRMTRRETPSEVKARLLSKSQTGFSSPKGK